MKQPFINGRFSFQVNIYIYSYIWLPNHAQPKSGTDLARGFGPPKFNGWNSKNEGLEDDFPFQSGDFQVPAISFPGCIQHTESKLIKQKGILIDEQQLEDYKY